MLHVIGRTRVFSATILYTILTELFDRWLVPPDILPVHDQQVLFTVPGGYLSVVGPYDKKLLEFPMR